MIRSFRYTDASSAAAGRRHRSGPLVRSAGPPGAGIRVRLPPRARNAARGSVAAPTVTASGPSSPSSMRGARRRVTERVLARRDGGSSGSRCGPMSRPAQPPSRIRSGRKRLIRSRDGRAQALGGVVEQRDGHRVGRAAIRAGEGRVEQGGQRGLVVGVVRERPAGLVPASRASPRRPRTPPDSRWSRSGSAVRASARWCGPIRGRCCGGSPRPGRRRG